MTHQPSQTSCSKITLLPSSVILHSSHDHTMSMPFSTLSSPQPADSDHGRAYHTVMIEEAFLEIIRENEGRSPSGESAWAVKSKITLSLGQHRQSWTRLTKVMIRQGQRGFDTTTSLPP